MQTCSRASILLEALMLAVPITVACYPLLVLTFLVATAMVSLAGLQAEMDRVSVLRSTWEIAYQPQPRLRSRKLLQHRIQRNRKRAKARRPVVPETNLPPNLGPGVGLGL
jgi:hypothetical protein